MIRLLRIYPARHMLRTFGSSKGILFDTCIIPRMMRRFVLEAHVSTQLLKSARKKG
jgi:hypothetical protein